MPLPNAKVIVNRRPMLMPSDSAMRRLSTAARICAPMRVRSKPSQSAEHDDDADRDQHDAVGAVLHEAEIDLALQRRRQGERLAFGPDDERHRGDHDEDQADGEQHLVELGRAVEPRVEQPLEHDADRRDDDEAERKRRPEGKPQRGSSTSTIT